MLHSVLVSYNRRRLTEQTLSSYLSTINVPYSLIIVDNGSNVTDWLLSLGVEVLLLGKNHYPEYAVNRGWERMPTETTLLMRINNDTRFLPGWCDEMVEAFEEPTVGQFGLIAAGDEPWTRMPVWPVGGPSIIRRSLYDGGLRYEESAWETQRSGAALFTQAVWEMGYQRVFATTPGIEYLDDGDFEYRKETHQVRGLEARLWGEQ